MILQQLQHSVKRTTLLVEGATIIVIFVNSMKNNHDLYLVEEFGAYIITIIGIVLVIILLAIFCGFGACVYFVSNLGSSNLSQNFCYNSRGWMIADGKEESASGLTKIELFEDTTTDHEGKQSSIIF